LKTNSLTIGHDKAVNLLCKYDADYEKLREMKNSQGKIAKEIASIDSVKFSFNSNFSYFLPVILNSILAVWKAAFDGNLDTLRRLHRLGENIEAQTPLTKLTPLIIAAKRHHLLVVKYLLDNKVNRNQVDSEEKTAFDYAKEALQLIKLDKSRQFFLDFISSR